MTSQLAAEHAQTQVDLFGESGAAIDEALLRRALCACATMRRSEDPQYVLDILTSTVQIVAPMAAVWAVRESATGPLSHASAFDTSSAFGAAQAAHQPNPAELLATFDGRLAPGQAAFDVDVDETPLGEVVDRLYRPFSLNVFPFSSPEALGVLFAAVPFGTISAAQRTLISLICDRAATALELGTARTAAQHTEALFETLTQLTASFSDPELVLEQIARSTSDLLRTDAAWIMLADDEKKRLNVSTVFGITNRSFFEASCGIDEWLCGAAIRKRRVVCVRDLHSHEQAIYSKKEGLRSTLCAPLFAGDELLGVLIAAHREIRDPSPEDRRIMAAFASAAAVSIGNARLYAEREESIGRLGEANRLLADRSAALERTVQFQQRLTEVVLAGSGLGTVVDTTTETLGCHIQILDRDLLLLHESATSTAHVPLASVQAAIKAFDDDSEDTGVSHLAIELDGGSAEVLVAPLDLGGERSAFVVVHGEEGLEGTDLGMTEAAVTAIGLELMRDRASAEAEARLTGGLFQALLSDEGIDEATINRRASYLGYELSGHHVVIAASAFDDRTNGKPQGHLSLQGAIQRAVRRNRDVPTPVFEREDAVFVLLSDAIEVSPALIKEHCALIKYALEASGRSTGARIAFAGPHDGIAGIRRAVNEATYALHVQDVLGKADAPVAFGDLGVWTLLGRVGDREHLVSFAQDVLGDLIAHDAERQAQLVGTLRTLINCNFHYRSAAEALFAHPNTIRYRMSRIAELTGLDLTNGDARLKVEIALRILDVIDPARKSLAG